MPDTEDAKADETLKKRLYGGVILTSMLWLFLRLLHDRAYGQDHEHVIETTRNL